MMADLMAAVILLAVVACTGYVVLQARASQKPAGKPLESSATCGCGHHYAFHDKSGRCHNYMKNLRRVDTATGKSLGLLPCICQRYTGPEPLPQYLPPEESGGQQ